MKGLKIIDRTLEAATVLSFLGVIIVVIIQILSRYFPYTAIWTEELTRYLFIYSISFGAPLALKKKEFINVDLLINLFPKKIKQVYEGIVYLIIAILSAIIAFQSYTFMVIGKGQTSATMTFIDMSIIHASIGITVIFLTIYAVIHVLDHFKGLRKGSENEC